MRVSGTGFVYEPEFRKLKADRSFFPTQVVMSVLIREAPLTAGEIWTKVKDHGLKVLFVHAFVNYDAPPLTFLSKSKRHTKKMLQFLHRQGRIATKKPPLRGRDFKFTYDLSKKEKALRAKHMQKLLVTHVHEEEDLQRKIERGEEDEDAEIVEMPRHTFANVANY